MNKTLKFKTGLADMVLAGTKTSTWRLWDDKDLKEGDLVDFLRQDTLERFATARLTKVIEKPLGSLSDDEKSGHERHESDEETYRTFSGYYGKEVNAETPAKIIWFELTEQE